MTLDEFGRCGYAATHTAVAVGTEIAFDGMIAVRLAACSTGIRRDQDIEIKDINGALIATLCPTRSDKPVEIASLTTERQCAFFSEAPPDTGASYSFRHDYVVIPQANRQAYQDLYQQGSAIWGGFVHDEPGVLPIQNSGPATAITARSHVAFPTTSHRKTAARAAREPYVFERFLKLYHMLELVFDYELVIDIRNLKDDLHGVAKLLTSYESNDLNRLGMLIRKHCVDFGRLIPHLNLLAAHTDKACEILHRFGKDGNPFKEETLFRAMLGAGGITPAGLMAGKVGKDIRKTTLDLTIYVIYRVRCCVAHHKIGEYLITDGDDVFLLEVAEPLLREVLSQVFARTPIPSALALSAAPTPALHEAEYSI